METQISSRKLMAGWGDIDPNSHMRNTAYLDKSVDVRMMFFAENGFPAESFAKLRFGPVVMKDEVEYFKEVDLFEEMDVNFMIVGISTDGSRFRIRNEFYRSDGEIAARVTSLGGWLDLAARKLMVPPEALLKGLLLLPKTADFEQLPSSIK